jgi:16S rRNA (uracil1498-N3)-methyltransferase
MPDARGGVPLKEALRPGAASIVYTIGPEGGFEDGERALLRERGFVPVVLGKSVLRVETAAIALLACMVHELG